MADDKIRFRVSLTADGRLRATMEGDQSVVVIANDLHELRGKLELVAEDEIRNHGARVSLMFRVTPEGTI